MGRWKGYLVAAGVTLSLALAVAIGKARGPNEEQRIERCVIDAVIHHSSPSDVIRDLTALHCNAHQAGETVVFQAPPSRHWDLRGSHPEYFWGTVIFKDGKATFSSTGTMDHLPATVK